MSIRIEGELNANGNGIPAARLADLARVAAQATLTRPPRARKWLTLKTSNATVIVTADGWDAVIDVLVNYAGQTITIENQCGHAVAVAVVNDDCGIVLNVLPR